MEQRECPYEVLGVRRDASDAEIKQAYRKASFQHHPDRNPGDAGATKRFQRASGAYESIKDAAARQRHQQESSPFGMGMGMGAPFVQVHTTDGQIPEELLRMFAGLGGAGMFGMADQHPFHVDPLSRCLPPIEKILKITLKQAYSGCQLPVEVERTITDGPHRRKETERVYVVVPQGVDENECIVMKGKGDVHHHRKGDLKVRIAIKNDRQFQREALDLHLRVGISLADALAGFQKEIVHISGKSFRITNSKGIVVSPGYQKRMPGLGMRRGGSVGEMVVHFDITFPRRVDQSRAQELRDLIEDVSV